VVSGEFWSHQTIEKQLALVAQHTSDGADATS
jgi:hypothetical protein